MFGIFEIKLGLREGFNTLADDAIKYDFYKYKCLKVQGSNVSVGIACK